MPKDDFFYIDLFAGAGGLSEGFQRKGFTPLAHVEADESATFTLKTRAAYHYLKKNRRLCWYHSYVQGKINRDEFYSKIPDEILNTVINANIGDDNQKIFKEIRKLKKGKKVDLIIGGPPCQAYSIVGRASLKHKADDERTKLYIHYGRFLNRYNPTAFLFENVPGLLTAGDGAYYKKLIKYFKRIGYHVEYRILNALHYNVIQQRERVIIIGWKKSLGWEYPKIRKIKPSYRRDDIFMDLPCIGCGENRRIQNYISPGNDYLKKTNIRNCVDYVSQHVTRPHNDRDIQIYKLAIRQLKKGRRLKNNEIPRGMRTQKNVISFLDRFKVVDKVPHTVIAHIAKDGHYYIHPDEKQLRSISIREAARIQSFPDDFYFEGSREDAYRSTAFKQIGNAVPPLMAEKIATAIKKMLT